jgi:hypothetical protein
MAAYRSGSSDDRIELRSFHPPSLMTQFDLPPVDQARLDSISGMTCAQI